MHYLGHLPSGDPLYGYLKYEIMPQLGADGSSGFRVFGNSSSHEVYIYEDRASGIRAVGKFYYTPGMPDFDRARNKMYREFRNIGEFRTFMGENRYAAKALGCNESLNCLLTVEYCPGISLDSVLLDAVCRNEKEKLHRKLADLAEFFAHVHNCSARPVMVDFHKVCRYFDTLVGQLGDLPGKDEQEILSALCRDHRQDIRMYQDQEVLVHGDATPANFLFGSGGEVITFDLEKMQRTDRVFDIGRIAGEIQHYFLRRTGNKYAAEPFISDFLREYSSYFPDSGRAFASITQRVPFYMGMTLLRIARNTYLPEFYRKELIREAILTLERRRS